MPSFRSVRAGGSRFLARYLSRLADNLETLTGRLRDGLASAIGTSVGEATREAVRAALDAASESRPSYPPPREYGRPDSYWREPGETSWPEYEPDRWASEDNDDTSRGVPGSSRDPPPSRWSRTVAAGLQAAAWWLRCGSGRFVVLTAAGVGLVAALAFWLSPPASVVTGMVAAALGLAGLLDTLRAGAAVLGADG
jgi:hypothetical protein